MSSRTAVHNTVARFLMERPLLPRHDRLPYIGSTSVQFWLLSDSSGWLVREADGIAYPAQLWSLRVWNVLGQIDNRLPFIPIMLWPSVALEVAHAL